MIRHRAFSDLYGYCWIGQQFGLRNRKIAYKYLAKNRLN